jgi:protein-S-isoprenylcysteine O-methyltransferase Ste14
MPYGMTFSIDSTQTMYIVLGIAFALWLCIEVPLSVRNRASGSEAGGRDKNTLSAIWATLVLANSMALIVACTGAWRISGKPCFVWIGIAIFAIGVVLRLASIVTLGRLFTYNVAIRDGHALKTTGLYRLMRHPGYAGLFIAFIGIDLALNDWLSFAIGVIPLFIVLSRRIAVEEKVLIAEFGDAYVQYQRRTRRLFPGIY